MQDSNQFAQIVTTLTDQARSAELHDVIGLLWPGGMGPDWVSNLQPAFGIAASDAIAFFDLEQWNDLDALWMLLRGEAPSEQPSPDRRTLSELYGPMYRERPEGQGWGDDDDEDDPWESLAGKRVLNLVGDWMGALMQTRSSGTRFPKLSPGRPFAVTKLKPPKYALPIHRHGWIRWALQVGLPIHEGFWTAYFTWKSLRWSKGRELAWLSADGGETLVGVAPVPAEVTWRVPLDFEYRIARDGGVYLVFVVGWMLERHRVAEAAEASREVFSGRRRRTLSALRKYIGGPLLDRVTQAIERFAASRNAKRQQEDGLFVFEDLRQRQLADELIKLDPLLAKPLDRVLFAAIGGSVRGNPSDGRPKGRGNGG